MYRRKSFDPSKTLGRREADKAARLSQLYKEVHETILLYQSHTLGLFPRGHSQHARVRDNVYCAMSLWAMSLAYRRVGWDSGRTYELEQSAVKCMRGILFCYMRQVHKVEQFKQKQSWMNALHSRFDHMTGDPVTEDDGWGHLQIDGTSLFLLVLSQMTASGLQVILTQDEVDFIQNLVYYIERAYRTPDFGVWERGSIENTGRRELHASSIGMAKAALDAIHGLNLFGDEGSSLSMIHVDPDAQYRNHVILSTLLPRESNSKETDAALLCITGFPAFTIDNSDLKDSTEEKLIDRLQCEYGFKRFAKDGHHTVNKEDRSMAEYADSMALEAFEGMECQWPIFFAYSYITVVFRGDNENADTYWNKLDKCLSFSPSSGYYFCPKLYYHSNDDIDFTDPGSNFSLPESPLTKMEPLLEEGNKPFLWAQSLFIIAKLLRNDLLTPSELDPLGLHLPPSSSRYAPSVHKTHFKSHHRDVLIQVALISSTSRLQAILATYGIPTQTSKQIESVTLGDARETLMKVYSRLGQNKKLGLSGRPLRPIGAIGTSKIYRISGRLAAFFPTDLNIADFYMSYDIELYIDTVKSILTFLNSYWNVNGRPTVTLLLRENLFKGGYSTDMINFLAQFRKGEVDGIKIRLDRLQSLIATSCIDNIQCGLEGYETDSLLLSISRSPKLRSRSSSLSIGRTGSSGSLTGDDIFTVETLQLSRFDPTPDKPEEEPDCSPANVGLQSNEDLEDSLAAERNYTYMLYILHELMKRYHIKHLIDHSTIGDRIQDVYDEAATKKHWMAVRLGASLLHKVVDCLAPSLSSVLVKEKEVSIGVFHYSEHVITEPMSPDELSDVIYRQCMDHEPIEAVLQQELLIYLGDLITRSDISHVFDGMLRLRIGWIIQAMKNELWKSKSKKTLYQLSPYQVKQLLIQTLTDETARTPFYKRQLNGALNRVPINLYAKVYNVLKKTKGITVWGTTLDQYPTINIMSAHEKRFSVEVEKLLGNISSPHYRQLVVELLMVVSTILERNPELNHQKIIDLDNMLKTTFALLNRDISDGKVNIDCRTELENSQEQELHSIYYLPESGLHSTATYMAKAATSELLTDGVHFDVMNNSCSIS